MKHKLFCRKDPVDRKVKGDSLLRRHKQDDHCEEYKAILSRQLSGAIKEEVMKVAQSCQNLGSKGDVKKSRAKGGRLPKTGKIEVSVQGGEDVVDRQVKEDSKVERLKQEEYCEEPKEALKVVQTSPQNIV